MRRIVMVGGPFSAATAEEREANIIATERLGLRVAEMGGAPIVPNSLGRGWTGTPSYEAWMEIAKALLARSDAFIVTPDWQRSSGTTDEIEEAFFAGVPWFTDIDVLARWISTPDHEIQKVSVEAKRRLRTVQRAVKLVPLLGDEGNLADKEVLSDGLRALQWLGSLLLLRPDADDLLAGYEKTFLDILANVEFI